MTTELRRLHEFLLTAGGQTRYLQWRQDELTQLMLGAMAEIGAVRPPSPGVSPIDHGEALHENGRALGVAEATRLLRDPQAATDFMNTRDYKFRSDYGAEKILKENS